MVASLKVSTKIVEFALVTRRLWCSVAAWRTVRSAIKGWSVRRQGLFGWRFTTPLFGTGFGIWVGESR